MIAFGSGRDYIKLHFGYKMGLSFTEKTSRDLMKIAQERKQ
jgi:hypothetical protein